MSSAMLGNEVAIIVESMFSMNRATATISGTRRFGGRAIGERGPFRRDAPMAERGDGTQWPRLVAAVS
jgi:hypothetical protein